MEQNKYKELSKQKLEAELKLLKMQIHPHFLFNTLNNLYALTLQKSDDAPKVVLKLSEILSYLLLLIIVLNMELVRKLEAQVYKLH